MEMEKITANKAKEVFKELAVGKLSGTEQVVGKTADL